MHGGLTITHETRPCFVGDIKALFHRWVERREIVPTSMLKGGHCGGVIACTFALVEYETGLVKLVNPTNVRFLDSANKFDGYDWSVHDENT